MIKLPADKNERNKILVAIGLGVAVVLYLAITFGLQPYLAHVRAQRERLDELDTLIWRAQRDLGAVNRNLDQNTEVVTSILKASETDRHILRPSLGNYLLVATDILTQAAAGLRIHLDNITEVPAAAPPRTPPPAGRERNKDEKPSNTPRFAPYTVNVSLAGGLHDLTRFLQRIETANPFLTLARIVVMGQADKDPETHFVNLHVQWPIWIDNEHPRRLSAELLADEEQQ